METTRRGFLKKTAFAALVLAAGGGIYRATHTPAPARFVLTGEAAAALHAIIPAILAGVLPADGAARAAAIAATTARVHQTILGLPLATQQEVQDLFGLLALAPARRFLAGVPHQWSAATVPEVSAFLQSWRLHRIGMLQSAYAALHDLVFGAWYADPATWPAIGYPGPIKELS
jgi:hypothetical protein